MSAPTLADLVDRLGGVAFTLGLDRPRAGDEAIRPLRANDAALRVAPSRLALASTAVRPGDVFAGLPGLRVDGFDFALDALERGASCVLASADRSLIGLRRRALQEGLGGGVVWLHPRPRRAAGFAAAELERRPSDSLRVAAVTGTNGKTSVCHLVHHLLRVSGVGAGLLGTAGNVILSDRGPLHLGATHTTPDAPALQALLRRHQAGGGTALVLEASSHALEQERLAGTRLAAAGFTNLTRDHLDYHGTLERYLDAKARIFEHLVPGGTAVIFDGGPASRTMIERAEARGARVVRATIEGGGDLVARDVVRTARGSEFLIEGLGILPARVTLPLPGLHNVENALVAIGLARALGASSDGLHAGIATVASPPGRLEAVEADGAGPEVFVDYAHTPDALERVLATLREELEVRGGGRLVCVFGCGGDRDRGKREPMGRAVGRLADLAVVTSDNPRSEDPHAIADEVVRGVDAERGRRIVEVDRRAAIERSIANARPGDIVLIAGKGHENTQDGPQGSVPFDDRVVASEVLRRSGGAE